MQPEKPLRANKEDCQMKPIKSETNHNLRPKKPCGDARLCKCYECSFAAKISRPNPRFKCEMCNYFTDNQTSFLSHQQIHLIVEGHKCDKCDFISTLHYDLIAHQRVHAGSAYKKFRCRYCLYYTDSRKAILQHQSKMHKYGKVNSENENTFQMVQKLFSPCVVRLERLTREEIDYYRLNISGDGLSQLPLALRRRQSFHSSSLTNKDGFKRNKIKIVKDGMESDSSSESESSDSSSSSSSSDSSSSEQCDFYSDLKKAMAMTNLLVDGKWTQLNGMVKLTTSNNVVSQESSSGDSSSDDSVPFSSILSLDKDATRSRSIAASNSKKDPSSSKKDSSSIPAASSSISRSNKDATRSSSIATVSSSISSLNKDATRSSSICTATNVSEKKRTLRSKKVTGRSSRSKKKVTGRSSILQEFNKFNSILKNAPSFGSMKREIGLPCTVSKRSRRSSISSLNSSISKNEPVVSSEPLLFPHEIKREALSPVPDDYLECEYQNNNNNSPEYIVGADLGDLDDPCLNNVEPMTYGEMELNESGRHLQSDFDSRPSAIYQLRAIKKEPVYY